MDLELWIVSLIPMPPFSVIVCVEASSPMAPERGGAQCGHTESPQRGRSEAGDGNAEAGSGAASRSEHAAHRSRRGENCSL